MKKKINKILSIVVLVFVLSVTFAFPFLAYADTYTDTSYGITPDGWLGTGFTMNLPSGVESSSGKLVTNFGSLPYFSGRPLDYSYYYADTNLGYYSSPTGFGFGTRYAYFTSASSSDQWFNDPTDFSDVYAFGGANLRISDSTPYVTWQSIYDKIDGSSVVANINSLVNGVGGPVPSFSYFGAIEKERFELDTEYESTFDSLPKTLTLYQVMRSTYDYTSTASNDVLQYDIYLSGNSVGVEELENGSTIRYGGFDTSISTLSLTSAVNISEVSSIDDKFSYAIDQYWLNNNVPLRVRKVSIDMQIIYDLILDNAGQTYFDELLYIRDFTFSVFPVFENAVNNISSAYNHIDIYNFYNSHNSVPIIAVSLDYDGAYGDSFLHNMGDIGNNIINVEGGGNGGNGGSEPISVDFTSWLSNSIGTIFNTKLFGFFGLGDILFTCLGVVLVFLFLKFFAGG